ncbi:MAG TPA: branched-chain amino acid ABC transporter substrate-binding protein [Gaiellaceae bacterium]|nr:branched-chain amino acid ABC transporter substrate-binding protein [Gaiellaceae bacterium]
MKKLRAVLGAAIVLGIAAAAASVAGAKTGSTAVTAAGPSCKKATIGVTGPFTGPAASAGIDQRNWADLFVSYWNSGKPIPGTPKSLKRVKLAEIKADTQLNPQVAATVAVQLRANKAVLAVVGFSGSQENVAGGPILRRGGLAFVSGSATRASLTDPSTPDGHVLSNGFFHRVVPNDNAQAAVDVTFLTKKLGIKAGETVMTVDQAEAYSVPLITLATQLLQKAGVKVDRQSQPATQTDFTSLAQKAVAEGAKAVMFAGQVASNAQLFLQQLKADGFNGKWISTDGTFDSSKFTVPGAYISSFSLDVHQVKADAAIVADFKKRYGDTISFGAPTWVATQMIAHAISLACADGRVTRSEVRADLNKVKLSTSLLGRPIAFQKSGDVQGGISFTIFQIGSDGKYNVVQPG